MNNVFNYNRRIAQVYARAKGGFLCHVRHHVTFRNLYKLRETTKPPHSPSPGVISTVSLSPQVWSAVSDVHVLCLVTHRRG